MNLNQAPVNMQLICLDANSFRNMHRIFCPQMVKTSSQSFAFRIQVSYLLERSLQLNKPKHQTICSTFQTFEELQGVFPQPAG